jgi:putative nucleotidyltransferase with HDIG domain
LLTRLIEMYADLREAVGSQGGTQWLVAAGMGFIMALAVASHPWRLAAMADVLGLTALSAVFLRVLFFAWYLRLDGVSGQGAARDLILVASLLTLSVWVTRGLAMFAIALTQGWEGLNAQALAFAAPLSAAPLLLALFLRPQAGMLSALGGGFLACLIWPDSAGVFAYYLVTGLVAAHYAHHSRSRSSLIKAGLMSCLPGLVIIVALALMRGWLVSADFPVAVLAAGLGGLVSGVLASGLAPVVEMALGYTTSLRLMEMASLDTPILRELMLQAPGTYHHSLVVSSLVEYAAKEIGADHLLAKVAALYHDLGKMKKAAYFVENQVDGPNRHEKLAPSMSALVLTSHVKEGVELARKHRLGQPIMDIIAQHHGTRVIPFFYNKAMEARRAAGQPDPDPQDFSYPGPRPQTREAGLVMLADTVEAASRSLDNATPARLHGLVQQQINKIFSEGQLDECELTLKDLHKIAKSFNTVLSGIFHQRLEYPQAPDKAEDKAGKRHGDNDRQPPAQPRGGSGGAGKAGGQGLRRLGLRA